MSLELSYNYDEFTQEKFGPWMQFDNSPPLGRPGPDFALTALDGETVRLKDLWSKAAYTIVEFGSFT